MNDNKRIAINTLAIYTKLGITTIVSLITARYVLLALGQSDYGLYSVVGSIIVLINTFGIAMYTTTRRYINVEMGKGESGNPNKIFNISLVIHICFAILFLIVAETLGLWYINNILQVSENKLSDAHFVFQVSTIVACLSLISVPFQGLMNAFQKFWQISFVEIIITLLKLALVMVLIHYQGNALRFYSLSMSLVTLCSFFIYYFFCKLQWGKIVKWTLYFDKSLYKEILVFNNYTAIGAASNLGRTQGSAMIINYFFGTLVNGSLAVAYQVQSFVNLFAGNIVQAAAPQITQAYSSNDKDSAFSLTSRIARITLLIMICMFFPLYSGLETIMTIWLKNVPDGAVLLTRWVLIAALVNSFLSTLYVYIQAVGRIKWFQITASVLELLVLPLSFSFFYKGFPPVTLFYVLSITSFVNIIIFLCLLKRIDNFNSMVFVAKSYIKPLIVAIILVCFLFLGRFLNISSHSSNLLFSLSVLLVALSLSFFIGLTASERIKIISKICKK